MTPTGTDRMIIGMDIDDTISRHPAFFSFLSRALVDAGHTVIILTVRRDRSDAQEQLAGWQVAHGALITPPDDLPAIDLAAWKARMCAESSIEVLFEDALEVIRRIDHDRTLCMVPIDPGFHDLG